ncbi:hypothetical protein A1O7_03465 [Cladophialophora yegresii CBS 114405]|uniref:Uncharacterized protein n=1 Tax=Cladophialophora yegresii CBS 114405 TaxID=1182544 RepID=W9WEL6_9EURO|nr:uncharacterized protein A1O7_03465 [Cladophialophora yegresii CBS 114405]EXJ63021.1 hypothetical protein A1O7_03465 [Cladophialophora yegresii CBS 114405]
MASASRSCDHDHAKVQRAGLLGLPPEVRHEIYGQLFCHKPSPITLGVQDFFTRWASFQPSADEPQQEPTFYTAIFRVNKAISRDALQYAYSANSFRFDKDIATFSNLGTIALASIKTLRVYKNTWLNSSYATTFWQTINHYCSSLELLIVEAASHVLLSAMPYLKDFMASIPARQAKPRLILDLTVLDRHFSFDFPDREYQSARQDLEGNMADSNGANSPRPQYTYVMRLPRHVKEIRFVLDMGPGAFRALKGALEEATDLFFVKSDDIPPVARDGIEGRGIRHCFTWQETGV